MRKYTFENGAHFSFVQQLDEYNRPMLLPRKWHHYCLSFAEQTATFTQVLVSKVTSFKHVRRMSLRFEDNGFDVRGDLVSR